MLVRAVFRRRNIYVCVFVFSVGIYRVHYPTAMLDALTPAIQDHTLSPQDRFNIQTDVYALARAGRIGYVDYMKLLRHAYKYEDNLTVWKSILRQLTELSSIFEYAQLNNTKALYQSYVCDLLENIYQQLGWDASPNEDPQAPILRSLILTHMGVNGYGKTRHEAHKRFQKFSTDNNAHYTLNPNIRAAIYLTVAKTGNQQTFDQLKLVTIHSPLQFVNLAIDQHPHCSLFFPSEFCVQSIQLSADATPTEVFADMFIDGTSESHDEKIEEPFRHCYVSRKDTASVIVLRTLLENGLLHF